MIVRKGQARRNGYDDGRESIHLSDTGGLSQFGVHLETLPPGGLTSERHWHTAEDEFLYVLEGQATVIDGDGAHLLGPGGAAAWRQGDPNAHHVANRSAAPLRYIIVGSRVAGDVCHYPDSGSRQVNGDTTWQVLTDAGLVSKSKDAQRRQCHLEAEVFDLMTTWIERYRRQAEARFDRLDAVLAQLNARDTARRPTTRRGAAS